MKVAVIGMGFVGGTIHNAIKNLHEEITLSAIDPAKGYNETYSNIVNYDAVFVCVPSPQSADGSADTSILRQVLAKLKEVDFKGVIISKVTAPPSVYNELQQTYSNLVHAPEFLTAANAYSDYITGKFAIIGGGSEEHRRQAEIIIKISQPYITDVTHCSIAEASFAKYLINSFLATKVVFMNEMAALAMAGGLNWQNITRAINLDSRTGRSHTQVPGPDGQYGFGGMCFPKDTAALLKYAESLNVDLGILTNAVTKNHQLRLTNTD